MEVSVAHITHRTGRHALRDGTHRSGSQPPPCLEGPWSTLVAVDLDVGEVRWERPAGTAPWIDVGERATKWGYISKGGPMVTQGGVVFLATTYDNMLRAYDGTGGNELWVRELPAGAHSTPMGFRHGGMDYVVVTAGGDLTLGRGTGRSRDCIPAGTRHTTRSGKRRGRMT